MITVSWEGPRVPAIAQRLGCHEKTFRKWLHRYNEQGWMGSVAGPAVVASSGSPRPNAPG
ncbi:helix-turn-helix domain-containing protein [Streptomyces sp. NPDC051218]|uniref:helix-turn-helix domain-containing protein n=1 Tax=Streptomyces sp. NPDC051218 TaxID=3365645 RepID=UPI00378C30B4